jgi:hypothetical protein
MPPPPPPPPSDTGKNYSKQLKNNEEPRRRARTRDSAGYQIFFQKNCRLIENCGSEVRLYRGLLPRHYWRGLFGPAKIQASLLACKEPPSEGEFLGIRPSSNKNLCFSGFFSFRGISVSTRFPGIIFTCSLYCRVCGGNFM